ncbi:MAG: hypothetical protein HGA76_07475 [Candidatus Firestonebacteria bacterium]|nr:hypothetical protein [Candidatus Firestonebacteria bacterium]
MTPREILAQCRELKLSECRQVNDEYAEVVIFSQDWAQWQGILENLLGPAVKPAGRKPEAVHEALANPRGGVKKDQILFNKKFEDRGIVALLWPWQDQIKITLKIFPE